jgi:hypothetical protein
MSIVKNDPNSTIFYPEPRVVQKAGYPLAVNTEKKSLIDPQYVLYSPYNSTKNSSLNTIRDYVMKLPEVYGRMQMLINDIVNGYEISCEDKELKKRVETYLIRNCFIEKLESSLFDRLISGDGYLEPVSIKQSDAIATATTIYRRAEKMGFLKKKFDIDQRIQKIMADEKIAKLFEPAELWWTDARWIFKDVDKKGKLNGYNQRIRGAIISATWKPGELINISSYKITNEVYGFTPLTILFNDLITLDVTKTYIKNFFENNGVPDYILSLKNVQPNSESFNELKKEILRRRGAYERGSLITTGEINFQQLSQSNKDMDFRELSKHIGEIMDLAWNIPIQKNSAQGSATRTIDSFFVSYYAMIRKEQKKLEDTLNTYLFSLFGNELGKVKIKFNNPYLRDAVRNIAWANIAYKDGVLSDSEYRDVLGLRESLPEDFEKNPYRKKLIAGPISPQNPFNGLPADNKVNPDKSPNPKPIKPATKSLDEFESTEPTGSKNPFKNLSAYVNMKKLLDESEIKEGVNYT